MTNQELLNLSNLLNSWKGCDENKINYCIEKNRVKIESALNKVKKEAQTMPLNIEYTNKKKELQLEIQKYADEQYKKLDLKYKKLFDKLKEIDNQENEDFVPYTILYDLIPEKFPAESMKVVYPFIKTE